MNNIIVGMGEALWDVLPEGKKIGLTGDVIYPIAQIVNKEADKKQTEAAEDFMDFLLSDEAAKVFESYYFDTDIK